MIDHNNIEEYIIDYIDGELTEEQVAALMDFIEYNNEYRQLLESYRNTVIPVDEEMVFGNKEGLLKQESKKKPLWLWPAAAVAAMLLIFLNIRRGAENKEPFSTKHVAMTDVQGQRGHSRSATLPGNNQEAIVKEADPGAGPYANKKAVKEKTTATGKATTIQEQVQKHQEYERNDMELMTYQEAMQPERLDYSVSITMEYADIRPYKPHTTDPGEKDRTVHFPLQDGSILVKDLKTQIETLKGRISQGLNDLSEMEITLFDKKINKN